MHRVLEMASIPPGKCEFKMMVEENWKNDNIMKYYGENEHFQSNPHSETRPSIFIEIQQKRNSTFSKKTLQKQVESLLRQKKVLTSQQNDTTLEFHHIPELRDHVESIQVCYDSEEHFCLETSVRVDEVNLEYRTYQLNSDGPAVENVDESASLAAATHWLLPSTAFHGSWDNLIYDSSIKSQLLGFAATTLVFSDHKVDTNIISWNKVVLLHGPPGTGKTSLCRALAHKLCIRLNHRYSYGQLIEINSHSLFSKWFSESGKLVMKMFEKIQELIDDPQALVFVLIDEVESLAHARKTVMSGSDPSDAIRVVNAVLTQIDAIKQYPNVMILTTSNVTGAIDLAFVDRADIKQYIGLPSPAAIFRIYDSCIQELLRVGIIWLPKRECNGETRDATEKSKYLHELQPIAELSKGLSGRTLRKMPFLAHALYIHKGTVCLSDFLKALNKAVNKHFQEMQELLKDQTNL